MRNDDDDIFGRSRMSWKNSEDDGKLPGTFWNVMEPYGELRATGWYFHSSRSSHYSRSRSSSSSSFFVPVYGWSIIASLSDADLSTGQNEHEGHCRDGRGQRRNGSEEPLGPLGMERWLMCPEKKGGGKRSALISISLSRGLLFSDDPVPAW